MYFLELYTFKNLIQMTDYLIYIRYLNSKGLLEVRNIRNFI